jgi:NUMOD3 motif-containing protein
VYVGTKSKLFGTKHSEATKALMSLNNSGSNNPLFGKNHSVETRALMSKARLGKVHSKNTKYLISIKNGTSVLLYEETITE